MEGPFSTAQPTSSGGLFDLTSSKLVNLDNLYPALVECFGIILLGYIGGRFNIMSEVEARGMNTFVGSFSLPALIFISLCQLDLSSVNYKFILSILIAKSILFFAVMIVTFIVTREHRAAKTAIYSIFVTQSNDFALGYPILQAIYGETHPEFASYMYLLAPISLVILNPIGFIILELSRASSVPNHTEVSRYKSKSKILFQVLKSILTNPIITMTVLGITANFVFSGKMPAIISQFLQTLGSAFSSTALFLLGLRMVGKMDSFKGSKIMAPLILVAIKLMAMPIISREVVSLFHSGVNDTETNQLANFAYLYGTFPTAPSVFVYSLKYNVLTELVAGSMVICTFVSAPLMFVSARLLSVRDINPSDYINELDSFLFDVSVLSLMATLWVVFVLTISRRWTSAPHNFTFALVCSQAIACMGVIFWSLLSCTHGWKLYLQFSVFAYGVYSARINTAFLSLTLVLMQIRPPCWIKRVHHYFMGISFALPALLVLILLLVVKQETPAHGDKVDPNFQYGITQTYVALIILILSFVVTSVSLVYAQHLSTRRSNQGNLRRFNRSNSGENSPLLRSNIEDEASSESIVPIEDLVFSGRGSSHNPPCGGQGDCCQSNAYEVQESGRRRYRCDSEHRAYCSSLVERYEVPPGQEATNDFDEFNPNSLPSIATMFSAPLMKDDIDLLRHTVLLLLLLASMFVGMAICFWKLVMDHTSGIYLELVFLDGFLNFGQGLFAFGIFGFDTQYILVPVLSWTRRIIYGQDSLVLPKWEDLSDETKQVCQQFIKHHISTCMEAIVKDLRANLNTYRAVFKGSELVDWLCDLGLARDRSDAVAYGRHLVKGRIIRHKDNYLDFYDDNFMYRFV